ncbi:MAG TPA: Gfo/Idh/MocA family oxidoreductase [Dehalococcoidia bacterium]|nr:Gfo/Idh/MocA family oxidoreductase [Dehalococcoidia bacterium]
MRIGVAGAGRMGALHTRTLCALSDVTAVVLADPNVEVARRLAAERSIDTIAEPETLLDASIDGLVIAAATDAHAELTIAAASRGIPVFCEKPAAPDAASTRAVLAHVADCTSPIVVGFQRRFDAGYRAAREAVRSGRLGWIHTIRACTLDPAPPPLAYLLASGGFFRDCSVHDFDAIRWITGQEVVEVYGRGAVRGDDMFREANDVDTVAALLELTDGTFAHVSASRYNAHGYDVRLEVLGSQHSIAVGLDERLPLESAERGVRFPSGKPYPAFMERFASAYEAELAAFVRVVAGDASPDGMCSLEDALEATLIAEACELSRIEGRPVRMDEVRG